MGLVVAGVNYLNELYKALKNGDVNTFESLMSDPVIGLSLRQQAFQQGVVIETITNDLDCIDTLVNSEIGMREIINSTAFYNVLFAKKEAHFKFMNSTVLPKITQQLISQPQTFTANPSNVVNISSQNPIFLLKTKISYSNVKEIRILHPVSQPTAQAWREHRIHQITNIQGFSSLVIYNPYNIKFNNLVVQCYKNDTAQDITINSLSIEAFQL